MDLNFGQPVFLLLGILFDILFIILYIRSERTRNNALKSFASEKILGVIVANVSTFKRRLKITLWVLATSLLFVALARPQYGYRWVEVKRKGIDMLIALDVSKSMLAEDIKPNRLERSKFAITDFVNKIPGDRVGLMLFAGESFLYCPITLDYDAFEEYLGRVDTTMVPRGGTDLASVIYKSIDILEKSSNHKFLILITDGEDLEGEALKAAEDAKKKGVKIFTVGVGSNKGELIPVKDKRGNISYLKDKSGKLVKSSLDEKTLKKIAEATGAEYRSLKSGGLLAVYKEKLRLMPKTELSERMKRVPKEQFYWPLLLAILFLILEFLLSDKKTTLFSASKKKVVSSLLLLLLANITFASPEIAEKLYKEKKYQEASKEYKSELEKQKDNDALSFNYATSLYKCGKLKEAEELFGKLSKIKKFDIASKSFYNLGNLLFKKGLATVDKNPQETLKTWEQSMTNLENAKELFEGEKAKELLSIAEANYKVVKEKYDKLKELLKQQQNKNQDKKQNQDKNKENQDKDKKQDKNKKQQNKDKKQDKKNQDDKKKEQQNDKGSQNGNNDKSKQNNQKDKQKEDNKKNSGQEPKKENSDKKEQKGDFKANNDKKEQQVASQQQKRKPGEMSKEEAMQLLDALKDSKKKIPAFLIPKGDSNKTNKSGRDW